MLQTKDGREHDSYGIVVIEHMLKNLLQENVWPDDEESFVLENDKQIEIYDSEITTRWL